MKYTVGLGDMLAAFSPKGYKRFSQAYEYDLTYTGSEANVLASLSCFGLNTKFVCRIPDNDIGSAAIKYLNGLGIDTKYVVRGGKRLGVLYLEKGASQRSSRVIYDRLDSGICESVPSDFDFEEIFKNANWFHFTGITPALSKTTPKVIEKACEVAKKNGCIISCDLNYRKNLWTSKKAISVMDKLMKYVDVLIANEEDLEKALGIKTGKGIDDYVKAAQLVCEKYKLKAVASAFRDSAGGSSVNWSGLLYTNGKAYLSKQYLIQPVSMIACGDSFSAGLIYAMQKNKKPQDCVEFATAAGCLKHTIEYDYNLVSVDEVETLINNKVNGKVQR